MTSELLTSKLFVPPLRPSLVPRPRLIQSLNEGLHTKRKLTLVSAPAGFGKTTLVVEWLKQVDPPAAWLSLDEADNDPPRFLGYLAAACQQIDEDMGLPMLSMLQSPQPPVMENILTGLLNEIAARKDPLILVLDDFHLLTEAAILKVMRFLLDHQPPQLHLVLTTREDPDLPLARLRARNQLTEIRARDLRFTQGEAATFLRDVMGLTLSEHDVTTLESRTEGWPVGLQLAGLSMQQQIDPTSFIADFSGSHRHILDYLTDEVIRLQPESIQTFLLQTSILDRLSGPLCDVLTGQTDSGRILTKLEAANLFVIPLDDDRRWYRYHHLFSDLLRSQLARSQPELIPELNRRASSWYEANGDIPAAIEHALQDTDLSQAARLIEQHARPKLYQGEVAKVLSWFDRLPEAIWQSTPMMCISRAWALALMQRGTRRGEVGPTLRAANLALERTEVGQALRNLIAGHTASIRAFLLQSPAMTRDEAERLIALSREAQRLLPLEEKAISSVNALNIGFGHQAMVNMEAASLAFTQAVEDGLSGGNLYAAVYGALNLVSIALQVGHLREALQLCNTNIERFSQNLAGRYFSPIGALHIQKGRILLELGRLAEAERALTEGLDLVRWTVEYDAHATGYTALARLRAIQGDRSAMLEAVKTLEEIWPQSAPYAQAWRHYLSMRHWPKDPNVRKDAQDWLSQSGIEFDELGVIDSVDPISTARFETYLNGAHVLAYLAEAQPGAYRVEGTHAYLRRQGEFAQSQGIVSWVVAVAIARTLLYHATGMKAEALETLQVALGAAEPTGLLRSFVEEDEPMQALLEELKHRLTDVGLIDYINRLLEGMNRGRAMPETGGGPPDVLSERELEVLRYLAKGLTYEEIGQHLFLSLNTVQFHVKNVYGKLLVNKRMQAIEKARTMNLI